MFPATSAAPATPSIEAFPEGGTLQVMVEGSIEPVLLKPKAELILGRKDPATGASPDIDLTPYAGYRMGVSRRHAAIRTGDKGQLDLWDLGSSNGTFLNGTRLVAYRAYTLNSGDEIRLGQMGMKVAFIRQTK
jgi:predicted component of type VI protein secretion system